jgi:hypothetical protein
MDTVATPAQPIVTSTPKKNHWLFISLIILTVISISITIFLLIKKPDSQTAVTALSQKSLLSGTFDINGVIPDGASIIIKRVNAASSSDTDTYPQHFPAVDQGTWSMDDITNGKTYTITATMVVNGKTIAVSAPLEVTAPASDETLIFNIPSTQPAGAAVISGNIRVD